VDVTCHLYGRGSEEERLRRLIKELDLDDTVTLEGPIPNDRFHETMNQDDVFVCASRPMEDGERDGIPVTLMEAMAVGIAVVSTSVSGIPELIQEGVNGYLVAPNDPEALAARLHSLIVDPACRRAVSAKAIQTIRRDFSVGDAVRTLDGWISRENGSAVERSAPATSRSLETI
jgi:glycosyltransferase involved in cell wall biosynthesis